MSYCRFSSDNCKYLIGDVCVNGDSEHVADFRSPDDSCVLWEKADDEDLRAEYTQTPPRAYRHLRKRNIHRLMEHFKTHNEMGNFQYV